jgi:arylsulfatase A-like enzyme
MHFSWGKGGRLARWAAAGGVTAMLLAVASCEAPPADPDRSNLIIISVDTLRPDHLGCYGSPRPTSPTIDAFARSGVLFEDALATSPWTLPSHGSLLTGRYPSRHGADAAQHAIPSSVARLGAVLAERGYRTSAVVNSVYLRRWGIEEGFRDFEYLPEVFDAPEPSQVSSRAIQWLQRRPRNRPFFLFLHYYDVHSDYVSLPEYEAQFVEPFHGKADGTTVQMLLHRRGQLQLDSESASHLSRLYDAGIRQFDDQLAILFDWLRERGLWDDTFVVLTADHGEEFLEHGGVLHGLTQYREVLAVPLLIAGPGVPPNTRIGEPVSLVDVMPTSLSLLGITAPKSLDGEALDVLWKRGDEDEGLEPRLIYTEADFTYDAATRVKSLGPNRSVRSKRFRLHYNVETRETALFDLDADPWEQVDVKDKDEHRQIAQVLLEHLVAFTGRAVESRETPGLTDSERDLLESLGYLR